MESKHGSESSKHPSKDDNNSINKDDPLAPLISVGESDHDSESEADVDITFDEKTSGSGKKARSSHSASSTSSESSSDFFQMDVEMLNESGTFPASSPKSGKDSQSPEKKDKDDTPGDVSSKSEDLDNTSPIEASSQISHVISNPTSETMSPVQSPPKQVMERSGDYDPNRIPASVFGSRPSSAMEWSAASNDSLFSLNIGSNSFSREQFLMMSGELSGEDIHKSEELYNSGELNKPGEANKSGLPPLSPVGKLRKIKTMDADKKPKQTEVTDEDISDQFEENLHELDGNGNSSMINRPSDASAASSRSFAFPILVDTPKYTSAKGPFPRKQDPKLDVYKENPQMKTHKKKSSSSWQCCCCYYCSPPEWSCPSSRHCWSWKWFKKWCCCYCCCDHCSSPQCSCPSYCHCWSWKWCKKWCCCCCFNCCR